MWKLADKTNRIRNENRKIPAQLNPADQRIERREEPLRNQGVFFRQRAKERRLAGVRIAHERNERQLIPAPALAMQLPMLSHLFDIPFQRADAMPDLPAVHFQFRFTGTARADAAAEPREVFPITGQARETVFQLRKLDLKLAFFRSRPPPENIEDQSGAVDDLRVEGLFQILRLTRGQLFVENNNVNTLHENFLTEFFDFTFADVCCRIGTVTALDHLIDDACAGRNGQLTQFIESVTTNEDGVFH